ncbi:MAG: molybdopterin-guanine dinucleotide biosynthesis protein B [Planctomycetota bacterium]
MSRMICVVGGSNSGKTRLISTIVSELSKSGWNVATAKHSSHSFSFEPRSKDTFKHRKSGAKTVLFLGPKETIVVRPSGEKLSVCAAKYSGEADVVIGEGFASEDYPKILVATEKKANRKTIALTNVRAVVCKPYLSSLMSSIAPSAPRFSPENIKGICSFIEKEFISSNSLPITYMIVNGKKIPLKGFVQDLIGQSILGMVRSLKGTGKPKSVEVIIKA